MNGTNPRATARSLIPLSEPLIGGNEWKYVKDCLDTSWVSSVGKFVDRFEATFARYLKVESAVAVTSGTAALHLALLVLGVGPGDEVLTTPLTFVATTNAIIYVGAAPVFLDVDPVTWNIDPNQVEDFLKRECLVVDGVLRNKVTGRLVRTLMVVHLYGHPADLDPLLDLAERYRLDVVEDASESLGARYKGRLVGTFGRISCFSFNGNKLITTGGGGMVVSNESALGTRARFLSTQARVSEKGYYHPEIGYNYRLTNVQAAIGLAQLERIDEFLAKKRTIAAYYQSRLRALPGLTLSPEQPWAESAFWLYSIVIDPDSFGRPREEVVERLNEEDIQARAFFIANHLLPPYREYMRGGLPVAAKLSSHGINLPSSVGITEDDLARVCDAVSALAPPP